MEFLLTKLRETITNIIFFGYALFFMLIKLGMFYSDSICSDFVSLLPIPLPQKIWMWFNDQRTILPIPFSPTGLTPSLCILFFRSRIGNQILI